MTSLVGRGPALFDLTGRVVVMTGAGRGLGRVMAHGIASCGATAIIADRDEANADRVAAEIRGGGGSALAIPVDVVDPASVASLFERTVQASGRLDGLVNAAAVDIIKPVEDLSAAEWDLILGVDLKGPFLCAQAAAVHMARQETGGAIVNITSIAGRAAIHGLAPYSAAKAGLEQLTRSLALEFVPRRIRVNAIAPGYFDNVMIGAEAEHARPEKQRQIEVFTPLGRRGRPDELIGPAVFLLSDASSYVTGATLSVDGGYSST